MPLKKQISHCINFSPTDKKTAFIIYLSIVITLIIIIIIIIIIIDARAIAIRRVGWLFRWLVGLFVRSLVTCTV